MVKYRNARKEKEKEKKKNRNIIALKIRRLNEIQPKLYLERGKSIEWKYNVVF